MFWAWLDYWQYRLRRVARILAFRCPACPGRLYGPHKMDCARTR